MSQKFLSVTVAVFVLFIVDGCQLNAVPEPGPGGLRFELGVGLGYA